jgi:16S rRNA (guanine966-N2)-methyltransferase
MRIIAGELKGQEIVPPRGSRIRPATGLVREMAMNLFTPARLISGPFLDLCAGTGLMGFEALSRGAPRAIFVEAEARTAAQLKRTAARLGVAARAVVLRLDARRCFNAVQRRLGGTGLACVFLDPPFLATMAAELLAVCGRHAGVLAEDGLLISRAPEALPPAVPGLRFISQRTAGRSFLALYGRGPAADSAPTEADYDKP